MKFSDYRMVVLTLVVGSLGGACSNEEASHSRSMPDEDAALNINGGVSLPQTTFPAVGAVMTVIQLSNGKVLKGYCTGTVICSKLVLTAAHCSYKVGDVIDGVKIAKVLFREFRNDMAVTIPGDASSLPKPCSNLNPASSFCSPISGGEVAPGYVTSPFDTTHKTTVDIAVATLAKPFPGSPMGMSCIAPASGASLSIAGYGDDKVNASHSNTRQTGTVRFDQTFIHGLPSSLDPLPPLPSNEEGPVLLISPAPHSLNHGDSGGPLISANNIIGVQATIGGGRDQCSSIDGNYSWLKNMISKYCPGTNPFSGCGNTLTVLKTGAGSGKISGPGIFCGTDCTEAYALKQNVTLKAEIADTSSTFVSWKGCGTVSGASCTVTMEGSKKVTVEFGKSTGGSNQLTVAKSGVGKGTVSGPGINCGTDCSESFATGTSVTLTATPQVGSQFAGWSGACSGAGTTCSVTMNSAKSVTANFSEGAVACQQMSGVPLNVSNSITLNCKPSGLRIDAPQCKSFPSATSTPSTCGAAWCIKWGTPPSLSKPSQTGTFMQGPSNLGTFRLDFSSLPCPMTLSIW